MGQSLDAERVAVFGGPELSLLEPATRVARDITGQHFALPNNWFDNISHRICTVRDLRGGEILGRGHLAQIRRVLRVPSGPEVAVLRCRRLSPHYRICLQDHNLLRKVRRVGGPDLESLLTGVLTHEYVHLVRFSNHQHPYQADEGRRAAEERRVDEITARILSRHGHRRLRRSVEAL